MKSLLDRTLLVEGETGVHLGGDLARYYLQDLTTELDKEVVKGGVDLLLNVLAMLLAIRDGLVDELGVFGLLGGGEDEGRVGGGVLRLVLADGGKVTRVADNGLEGELFSVVCS